MDGEPLALGKLVKPPIYLDYQATTPVDPRVLEAMLPYFGEHFGNAASFGHAFGWIASEALEMAREQVASLIGARTEEITFTSGATESNNLILKGVMEAAKARGNHLITLATEHRSVLAPVENLARHGFHVTIVPVGPDGLVDCAELRRAINSHTILVSVMHANNEIGVLQPLPEIGALCRERGVLLHTDAAQAAGKIPFDVNELHVDLVSLSAHKMYGPKGIGALYVRKRDNKIRISRLLDGGGAEGQLRPGTPNVPGAVGMGAACQLAQAEMAEESGRIFALRERLRQGLLNRLEGVRVNGALGRRLPGNLNLSFDYIDNQALIMALKDVAVSASSACASGSTKPSHVLLALGLSEAAAKSAIRFGIGRFTTEQEIDQVIDLTCSAVAKLRSLNPLLQSGEGAGSAQP